MRETAQLKAARLAGQGRVTIRTLTSSLIIATVRGDSAAVYSVTWTPSGWSCMCPALSRRCSHVRAVMLCVLEPLPSLGPGPDDDVA